MVGSAWDNRMSEFELKIMQPDQWDDVSALIYDSTNAWYVANGKPAIFTGPRDSTRLFCEVYEALDPGCCVIAEDVETGSLAGSCFFHPRITHVSLGIMNVSEDYFGQGVARKLLRYITQFSEQRGLPTRLVSSAMNLDSFSLYNREGFVPTQVFQDMILTVPEDGLQVEAPVDVRNVRSAVIEDLPAIIRLEREVSGIERDKDWEYFISNEAGIWHVLVYVGGDGRIKGVLVSVNHPGSTMIGPGVMLSDEQAIALVYEQLNHLAGATPVWLIPSLRKNLVSTMYEWGAKNCELHFAQVLGPASPVEGVVMPTFMPETG